MRDYAVQFRYDHRRLGPEGRTIRVQASSMARAITVATRQFINGLDRKERFDAAKKLSIVAMRTVPLQEAPREVRAVLDRLIDGVRP